VRILIAPDSFKGTIDARPAAEAIARGWRRRRPDDDLEVVPLADGGEGTLEALAPAERVRLRASGPLGDPVEVEVGLAGGTGVVETARVLGLGLLARSRRDPRRTTSRGAGELIRELVARGAERLFVALGGSATNDGGVGMAQALGARFLDGAGRDLPVGGLALLGLARIDLSGLDPGLARTRIVGLVDVDNPLTGPTGASLVYGPQKGAGPQDAVLLDRALGHLAAVVHRDLGIDLAGEPGAGAAGGLGFGLLAFCGARLRPGAEVVMDALGIDGRLERADLVITGEGSLDAQTLRGKLVHRLLGRAALAGVPAVVVCGRAEVALPGVQVRSLVERVGSDRARSDPRGALERVGEELAVEAVGMVRA
jgi:glycerate kinase